MKKLSKIVAIGLLVCMTSVAVFAQNPMPQQQAEGQCPNATTQNTAMPQVQQNQSNILPQTIAHGFVHGMEMFAIIDSVDNGIDILVNTGDSVCRVNRDTVDIVSGVHDLTSIYYPRSVMMIDGQIIYLASNKDSSLVRAIIATPCGKKKTIGELYFEGPCNAFEFVNGVLTMVGDNPSGYTVASIDFSDGDFSRLSAMNDSTEFVKSVSYFNYRKPRKAEEIAKSDPIGIGLTVAAVSVVFLVLMLLAILFTYYGKAIVSVQKKKAEKTAKAKGEVVDAKQIEQAVDHSGEIDAAIAAAIYLFTEELHDEEDTVITIQKVERAWTPWNAKYYNMNQYFNKRH